MDIHELDADYLRRCAAAAAYAAKRDGWKVVECAPNGKLLPKEEIFNKILGVLEL